MLNFDTVTNLDDIIFGITVNAVFGVWTFFSTVLALDKVFSFAFYIHITDTSLPNTSDGRYGCEILISITRIRPFGKYLVFICTVFEDTFQLIVYA